MNDSRLFLCAPVNALVEGIYEQKIPFTEVKKHGDFGLGTFDNLDGEMVMLEGRVYQITADGHAHKVDEKTLTPFACVTFYNPISHDRVESELDYDAFLETINSFLLSPNICYAIRIDGLFAYIKARSVPKQENYRPLVDVAKDQPIFHFSDVEGTLAGFFYAFIHGFSECARPVSSLSLFRFQKWRTFAGMQAERCPGGCADYKYTGAEISHKPGLSDMGLQQGYC